MIKWLKNVFTCENTIELEKAKKRIEILDDCLEIEKKFIASDKSLIHNLRDNNNELSAQVRSLEKQKIHFQDRIKLLEDELSRFKSKMPNGKNLKVKDQPKAKA